MRTVSSKMMIISLLIICFTGMQINLHAQKIKNMDPVTYLQLPTLDPAYGSVDVFVEADQSGTRDAISFGLGKLAGKQDGDKNIMDDLVDKVFANQVEKYGNWSLYEGNIAPPDGSTTLKAVITYSPDDSARPMGTPMKNNKQQYTFNYRVKAEMRIYNENEELLASRDFGVITGKGHSDNWPENATNAGSMFSVTTTEEGESSEKHPYEIACIEGAIEQTYRVLYGMYGIKEFEVPLTVAIINKQKESKDYFEKYKEIMEGKSGLLLDKTETAKMQECVDYWESILSSTKEEYLWAVHYDLAIGYGWLLNAEKSQEHISEFEKLKKDTFDKIINKSGSFTNKDTDVLDAYNMAQPFAQYYAEGINLHRDWVDLLTLDLNSVCEVNSMNFLFSDVLGIPVMLPIFPENHQNIKFKKGSGEVLLNNNKILEMNYNVKKGILESLDLKGTKKTIADDIKDELIYQFQKDKEYRERYQLEHTIGSGLIRGKFCLNEDQIPLIHSIRYRSPFVWKPFDLKNDKISGVNIDSQALNSLLVKTDDNELVEYSKFYGGEWYSCAFTINDSVDVTISADNIETVVKPLETNENGIPARYQVTWNLKDADFNIHAHIKYKFAEETYAQQRRQDSADAKARPVITKKILDNIEACNGTYTENDKGNYDISVTCDYDFNMETDSNGNWIKLSIGDYTITRELKY